MNILPFVLTFMIIFSCFSFTFMEELKSVFRIESVLEGLNSAERSMQNVIAYRHYRQKKTSAVKHNQRKNNPSTEKEYHSKRTFSYEKSRFNLSALLEHSDEAQPHVLYQPLVQFIHLLYGKQVFVKEAKGLESRFIEALIKKRKGLKQPPEDLSELCPDDPHLMKIFYKLLQGTNQFDFNEGIIPLKYCFTLEKEGKKTAFYFSFASPPLLTAFFGENIKTQILKAEQQQWLDSKKYHFFSKDELHQLMNKPNEISLLNQFEPLMDFSKNVDKRKQLHGRDKKTGIGVEKPMI